MKTSTYLRALNIGCVAGIAVAGIWITTSAPAASIGYLLTLTENSSTSLSLAYTGPGGTSAFSITPNGADDWTVTSNTFPSIYFNEFTADFLEPENPNEVNEAYTGDITAIHASFTVESDQPLATYQGGISTTYPNGGITITPIGADGGVPIFLQFFDNAAANEAAQGVPEAGSSIMLVALSSAALFGLRRLRSA